MIRRYLGLMALLAVLRGAGRLARIVLAAAMVVAASAAEPAAIWCQEDSQAW